jgi:adhesin transport system membrane fusion protein
MGSPELPLLIIPGLVATVDIITGEKSVLDYLLKPVLKARSEALRER